jgi:hypothetical protein
LNGILLIGAGVVLVGALAALALVRARDFHHPPVPGPPAAEVAESVRA